MDHATKKLIDTLGKNEPWHNGQRVRGQTLDWYSTDSEENFNGLIQDPQRRDYFEAQGWLEPGSIVYRFNRHGFRGNEFDSGPHLLTLGCSFTLGIGLPEKDVWPYRVGAALGFNVANLSVAGASADTCLRLALHWISRLEPKLVIMLTPLFTRQEICVSTTEKFDIYMPSWPITEFENDKWIKYWYLYDINSQLNSLKNQLGVQKLCDSMGIPCKIYNCLDFLANFEKIGYARDFMHAGVKGHDNLVTRILNDWNETQRQ